MEGIFSQSLKCLEVQINHLLAGVGGEQATRLLDSLSTLSDADQEKLLTVFRRVTEAVASAPQSTDAESNFERKAFEEHLFRDIMKELAKPKLALVDRSRRAVTPTKKKLVSLALYRNRDTSESPSAA